MLNYITDIFSQLRALDRKQRIAIASIAGTMFFLLFSYPIVRSTTQAMFLDAFKAKSSPYVWLYSVIVLSFSVTWFSWMQKKWPVQTLFIGTSIFTAAFFWVGSFFFESGSQYWAYPLFVWKEVYIVVLVHMALGYLNNSIEVGIAKIIYGPMGAMGSIGGIVGGLMTSALTSHMKVSWILALGAGFILFAGLMFSFTLSTGIKVLADQEKPKESPLHSLGPVKNYVMMIAGVIILSQFCISLANFKFNILLEQFHQDKASKTQYLGQLYSAINVLSLIVQIFIIPLALKWLSLKSVHRFIPICYLLVVSLGFGMGGHLLLPVAASFVVFKGVDYSLFSAAKELLYFPLNERQKYGAKYICDMLFYRLGKGLISIILIFIQTKILIDSMLIGLLILWLLCLIPLFRSRENILS